jgi:CIC family chloride channel protein
VLVIRIKDFFARIPNNFLRVNLGALLVGTAILFLPFLYGDSYHGLIELIRQVLDKEPVSLLILALLIVIKPLVAALTLGAGGDGGVFAPSIVIGAVLGLFFALVCNQVFHRTHSAEFCIGRCCRNSFFSNFRPFYSPGFGV